MVCYDSYHYRYISSSMVRLAFLFMHVFPKLMRPVNDVQFIPTTLAVLGDIRYMGALFR